MNRTIKNRIGRLATALLITGSAGVNADVSGHTTADFTAYPLVTVESVTPMVMLNNSNDHQLFFKAYNDYSDIDQDDTIDTTYNHGKDYYGYFDSHKCYTYDAVQTRFEPAAATADKYCNGIQWSGNFLNWASMARIDAVRKILFGGLRSTDSSSETVLERAYLPNDAHSWAKYYNGNDIKKLTPFNTLSTNPDPKLNGITICNTTVNNGSATSQNVTDPPLVRVAKGNYSLWASNERWQCRWQDEKTEGNGNDPAKSGIDAYNVSPKKAADGLGDYDYVARVQVCVAGLLEPNCRAYPNGNHKPAGLLQKYGEDDQIYFGMVAGSYNKNKSGGDVVKDVGTIADEIDVNGDGHFTKVAALTGKPTASGIINAWSLYRVVGYKHADGTYGTAGLSATNCTWGKNSFANGQCMNWGNPFGEIFLNSIRYLAGQPVTGQFRGNDSATLPGLNTPNAWDCPLDGTTYCSPLNVVNFNSSVISYDNDEMDGTAYGVGAIWSGTTAAGLTDLIGAGEGIHGNDFFIGENGTDVNQICSAKTLTSLGAAAGLCPEAPRLSGTYRVAGVAYKAHISDIRSADVGSAELNGDQLVDTYSVTLAPTVPTIEIPVPGSTKKVKLLPACRNSDVGGNCAIVDFKIVEPHTEVAGTATGKFYVNWEDSEQGGDFDQDMWGTIAYTVTNSQITVTTDVHAESTVYHMGFGYVVSGTSGHDGFHAHSGIEGFNYTSADGTVECSACQVTAAAASRTYPLGTGSASLLKDPLYYAAKWGGFTDENGNGIPDLQSEWDRKNASGLNTPDGIPDNYFYVTDPQELEAALGRVFNDIIAKTASDTAAAVVASSREGIGAIYQALYESQRLDAKGRKVRWVGNLHSLWIDEYGYMREDANGNHTLDNYQTDPVVQLFYDESATKARVRRYTSSSTTEFVAASSTVDSLENLAPIWSAREQLASLANVLTQRAYSTTASSGRHVFTWIDADRDGVVDTGEVVNFDTAAISATNYGFFDVASEAAADGVVEFIRGKEDAGSRSRTIDYDNDGTTEVMRLGDIVDSTPTVVAAPAEAFDLLYNDTSYATFRKQYKNRRHMVYVGANDGLLHAFNAGFYDLATRSFKTTQTTETEHPLGSELWAYAPFNLLPHLQWLKDPNYTHVYYIDGKPRAFDAKIFSDDSNHPGGWGTVLVVGMRFGGTPITVDTAADGLGAPNNADDHTFHSAYILFDITNPEVKPTLLGEISHTNLGYTTSYPAVFAVRETDDDPNKWFLVFGTGPTAASSATSTQIGRILVYDLNARAFASGFGPADTGNRLASNSFVGSPVSVDWSLSYKADAVYFGTAEGTAASPGGKLYKIAIKHPANAADDSSNPGNWVGPTVLLNAGQPIIATPTVANDQNNARWLYVGTGRYFVSADKSSTVRQSMYGIKEPDADNDGITTYASDLPALTRFVDVTDAQVFSDGAVENVPGIATFDELEERMIDTADANYRDGWRIDLPLTANAASRSLVQFAMLGKVVFAPAYTPNPNQCEGEGTSDLYALYFRTGTALPDVGILGFDETVTNVNGGVLTVNKVSLGRGMVSSPSVHIGSDRGDGSDLTLKTQTSTGVIGDSGANTPDGLRSGEISWREMYR